MKKLLVLLSCCLMAGVAMAQSWKIVINKINGQTMEVNTSEVRDIQVLPASALVVSELTNSGCMEQTRAAQDTPAIVMRKEGDTVDVELLNYNANCATTGFEVLADASNDGAMVDVCVSPISQMDADCTCPFNVSFKLQGLTADSFYLTCWWFSGQVSFVGTNEIRLECDMKDVTIDGVKYRLFTSTRQAVFWRCNNEQEGELVIPSEVTIDGEDYTVTGIGQAACKSSGLLARVVLPKTLSCIFSESGQAQAKVNPFTFCAALTGVEVEEGNNWFKAVDDMLMSKDGKVLYSFPHADTRTTFEIPEGVEHLADYSFAYCPQLETLTMPATLTSIGKGAFTKATGLRTLDFPERTTNLGSYLFVSTNLERIVFRGEFDSPNDIWGAFLYMNKNVVVYVLPSMVEMFKQVYGGTVLQIEE